MIHTSAPETRLIGFLNYQNSRAHLMDILEWPNKMNEVGGIVGDSLEGVGCYSS